MRKGIRYLFILSLCALGLALACAPILAAGEVRTTDQAGNRGPIIYALAICLVLLYFILAWLILGRDPAPGIIIPRYEPPKGMSPAAVRYVARMGLDHKILAATLINMAVKGYLKIERKMDVYLLQRTDLDLFVLADEEMIVADWMELKKRSFFAFRPDNRDQVFQTLCALGRYLKGKYHKILFTANTPAFYIGMFLALYTPALGLAAGQRTLPPLFWLLGFVVLLVMLPIFYRLLKAPTKEGRALMDQIAGFRLYLSMAEKDRLNLLNPPEETPALYEKYLPYALALDVEQQWAEHFSVVMDPSVYGREARLPAWYCGGFWDADLY